MDKVIAGLFLVVFCTVPIAVLIRALSTGEIKNRGAVYRRPEFIFYASCGALVVISLVGIPLAIYAVIDTLQK